jgi:apolipoprotein D and lipocalin family protein
MKRYQRRTSPGVQSSVSGVSRLRLGLFGLLALLAGCVGLPENVRPVDSFKVEKYLGQWYEVARFDHSFERGLSKVTADYSARDDGGISVVNRGYSEQKKAWTEAKGKAYFVDKTDQGHLKVSFFGPFYASYVVVELDKENYQYSMITGPDKSYLWILSRTPKMNDTTKAALVAKAQALGYDTAKLIWVEQ